MKTRKFFIGRSIGFFVILAIIITGAAFQAFNNYIYEQKQGEGNNFEPYQATLTGEYVCLPHRDTAGPQTLECAYGIKTEVGEHYALDFGADSQDPQDIIMGKKVTITGIITPIERLSTDQWQKYDVEGIFSVTDSDQKIDK